MLEDRKSTRLNSSHTVIYTLSLHDALPIYFSLLSERSPLPCEKAVYSPSPAEKPITTWSLPYQSSRNEPIGGSPMPTRPTWPLCAQSTILDPAGACSKIGRAHV